MKLDTAIENYVTYLVGLRMSDAHTSTVKGRLARFCRRHGRQNITAITGQHIDNHFKSLEEAGLASATRAGYKSTHRAFWKWCQAEGLIDANPADVLLCKTHRYDYRPVTSRPAPSADFQAVINCLTQFAAHRNYEPRDVRDAAMVSIVVDSARRRGEIWNLNRRVVESALKRGETTEGQTVYRASSTGKTGQQTVIWFEQTAILLRRWITMMPAESGYLWVNLRTGKRLHPDTMSMAFIRICEYANVPVFRFHAVRKRDVTDIIAATGDYKVGQILAGHKDERTTQMHYNEVEQQRVEIMAARLATARRGIDDGTNGTLADSFFCRIK